MNIAPLVALYGFQVLFWKAYPEVVPVRLT